MTAMQTAVGRGSQRRWNLVRRMTASQDVSHGASNPESRPRAGNISSDTRAGVRARSGA